MAGCIPCFVIPLLLFIFHRFIQPIILKFWNPWGKEVTDKDTKYEFECPCAKPGEKKDEIQSCQKTTKVQ